MRCSNMFTLALALGAVAWLLPACGGAPGSGTTLGPDQKELNNLVDENREFDLEPEKPLSKDNEERVGEPFTVTEVVQTEEGERSVTTTYVEKRDYYSALTHPDKFVLYNVNAAVLWPGNLIQGVSIPSGALSPIPISGPKRQPIQIFMSIVTGSGGDYLENIENPTGSRVFAAMNGIVGQHYGSTPGQSALQISRVYNMQHIMFNLNAGYSVPSTDIAGSFNFNWEEEKERIMVKFAQQYYSLAVDPMQDASDVFSPGVRASELIPFTAPDNPVCYIDSVTFGRLFVFIYESENSEIDLEGKISAAFQGMNKGSADAEAAYRDVVQNSTIKAYSLGGNAQEALDTSTDFSRLKDYLINGAFLSADSPGAPISYTLRYLKNANPVRLNNTLEYHVDMVVPVGEPESEPTESTYKVYFDQINIIAQDDGTWSGGSEGAIGMRLYKFEDGVKEQVFDTGLFEFEGGEIHEGATRRMDENTGNQYFLNVAGNKLVVEAYGYEKELTSQNDFAYSKDLVYGCEARRCGWEIDSDDERDDFQELFFRYETSKRNYFEFGVEFALTIDGTTLQ